MATLEKIETDEDGFGAAGEWSDLTEWKRPSPPARGG